ncbi:hypothetical protein AB0O31_18350 [Kitasatospora cineracea]|uniref:hypothetical protein n=1 Tax=Kitasatospora cineracea TaxID=88074 RepID=UPI003435028F
MSTSPSRGRNVVGLYLFVDSNTLIGAVHRDGEHDEAARELFRLWEAGWIALGRTDTMDTERTEDQDEATAAQRQEESACLPEAFGPFVLDDSRLDHAVLGSDEDDARIRTVFSILFPSSSWETVRRNSRRDAMHVATTARYGGHAFVTNERGLLNKDEQIAAALGIRLWSPTHALERAYGAIAARRRLHALEPERGPLPDYPVPTSSCLPSPW